LQWVGYHDESFQYRCSFEDGSLQYGCSFEDESLRYGCSFEDESLRYGCSFEDGSLQYGCSFKDESLNTGAPLKMKVFNMGAPLQYRLNGRLQYRCRGLWALSILVLSRCGGPRNANPQMRVFNCCCVQRVIFNTGVVICSGPFSIQVLLYTVGRSLIYIYIYHCFVVLTRHKNIACSYELWRE
jgi:hypothetical protein